MITLPPTGDIKTKALTYVIVVRNLLFSLSITATGTQHRIAILAKRLELLPVTPSTPSSSSSSISPPQLPPPRHPCASFDVPYPRGRPSHDMRVSHKSQTYTFLWGWASIMCRHSLGFSSNFGAPSGQSSHRSPPTFWQLTLCFFNNRWYANWRRTFHTRTDRQLGAVTHYGRRSNSGKINITLLSIVGTYDTMVYYPQIRIQSIELSEFFRKAFFWRKSSLFIDWPKIDIFCCINPLAKFIYISGWIYWISFRIISMTPI